MSLSRGVAEDVHVCDVGMPVVLVIISIPPLFAYFLALPSLLPSAITIIVFYTCYCDFFGDFQIIGSRYHDSSLFMSCHPMSASMAAS